ncbi:hypothetical protein Scep_022054 [Stephania cephalantha]|uniref:Uncharacterized protein n=1 Tax=Stephania cephalantha TaxID=152367 RepID=A0AAP0I1Y4_9MAGN
MHVVVQETSAVVATLTVAPTEMPTATPAQTDMFETSMTAKVKLMREFIKFDPGYFHGGGDPDAAEKWLIAH